MAPAFIPEFTYLLEIPEWPEDVSKRLHNQFAKTAAREALENYQILFTPRKFKREAHNLYKYHDRKPGYIRWKNRRYHMGGMDMVKTGDSRDVMTKQYKIKVGGSAANNDLSATLTLRFPFKGGTGRFRKPQSAGAISLATLILEMQTFADDEPKRLAKWFLESYMRQVNEMRSTRRRVRIRS